MMFRLLLRFKNTSCDCLETETSRPRLQPCISCMSHVVCTDTAQSSSSVDIQTELIRLYHKIVNRPYGNAYQQSMHSCNNWQHPSHSRKLLYSQTFVLQLQLNVLTSTLKVIQYLVRPFHHHLPVINSKQRRKLLIQLT